MPSFSFNPRAAALQHAGNVKTKEYGTDISDLANAIACGLVYVGDQIGEATLRQEVPPTPIERLGVWLATNMGLPDNVTHANVDEAIDRLGATTIGSEIETLFGV